MLNKSAPETIDTLIISGKSDIRLLRHFFRSQEIFSKLGGKTHLLIWKSEQYLLDQIHVPDFVVLHYKDDVGNLIDDDFRNQMYIKVTACDFIDSEWFWIADADYLICEPIVPSDFFNAEGRPYWFYSPWNDGPAAQRWRAGGDVFLGYEVPYLFLDEAQFMMNTTVLRAFKDRFDLRELLHLDPIPADCHVYAAFAYEHFRDLYDWIDMAKTPDKAIVYKVNQQPPTYCLLEPDIRLSDVPKAKYYVFWSHWELAEQKMIEFLRSAAERLSPPLRLDLDETEITLDTSVEALRAGKLDGVKGLHLDGWTHKTTKFMYEAAAPQTFVVTLDSPGRAAEFPATEVDVFVNGHKVVQQRLVPGLNSLEIEVNEIGHAVVSMEFSSAIPEPNGSRELFARLLSIEVVDRQ